MSQVTSVLSTSVSTLAAGPATTSAAPTTSAAASTTSPVTSASPSSSSSPTTATSSASNGSSSSVTSIGTTASTTTSTASQSTSTFVVPVTAATSPVETTSGGSVFTVVVTSTSTPSSPNSDSSGSTSFWNNTGAVVGVFTVVGLIGLALLILIITTAIRRRRAVKFDKEIAAAAADAAAAPRFPFDDYSDPSGGGGGYGYSDNSHGTYAQPPMRPVESYGMTEMSQYEPYAVGAASGGATAFQRSRSRKESEVGTPGIAGVGAGNLAREPSRRAPYHAFAGPNPQDLNDPAGNVRYPRSTATQDVLEAAGLAGTGAAALAHDGTGTLVNRRPSDYTQNTHRSGRSHGYASSSEGGHPSPLQPGYRQESNIPQRSNSRTVANASDPYGVYVPASYPPQSPSPPPRNPLRMLASSPPANDYFAAENEDQSFEGGRPAIPAENRVSLQDDTDYAQEPRVLRVMNE
ncbi:hypothetical protein EDD17DRAFT_1626495 [Pisolithus thermaeus]|nr:hypothetical protein EV401DRAFT_1932560 [Pisolithus croceorrhizus]KAI6156303.1 hypothetical protein EDD17DRAFT_1626495 [Pisolithus thermaeus]